MRKISGNENASQNCMQNGYPNVEYAGNDTATNQAWKFDENFSLGRSSFKF